jgi:hypothetical protein
MKSSIKYGLVLFSVLMSLSLGVAFAEKQMASNETNKTALNETNKTKINETNKTALNATSKTVLKVKSK